MDKGQFCVACGKPEQQRSCPVCAGSGRRSRHRRWIAPAAVTVALAASLVTSTVALVRAEDAGNAATNHRRAAETAAAHLTSRLDALEEAASGVSRALAGQPEEPPELADIAQRALPSVLTVVAGDRSGSAWVVRREPARSLLVTNFHVVGGEWVNQRYAVRLERGDGSWQGRVVDVAEADDLAVVEVPAAFEPLSLRREVPRVGESVVALGSPLGLEGTATTGIVSAIRDGLVQFSAPVSPGSSGGPLLGEDGRVVGVTVSKAVATGAEGLSFAVPVAKVCESFAVCS